MLGFPSVNYQEYLNFSLQVESTLRELLVMLVRQRREYYPPSLPLEWHSTLAIELFVYSVLGELRIRGMGALGLSHQWPQQQDSSNRVLYVPGAWLCNILIQFSAPPEVHKNYPEMAAMETITLDVRIRPVALLDHSRLAILPSLLVTLRVFFSSEALQLFFRRYQFSIHLERRF